MGIDYLYLHNCTSPTKYILSTYSESSLPVGLFDVPRQSHPLRPADTRRDSCVSASHCDDGEGSTFFLFASFRFIV